MAPTVGNTRSTASRIAVTRVVGGTTRTGRSPNVINDIRA